MTFSHQVWGYRVGGGGWLYESTQSWSFLESCYKSKRVYYTFCINKELLLIKLGLQSEFAQLCKS